MVTVAQTRVQPKGIPNNKPKSIVDRLKRPVFDDSLRMLIYGASGTGKTTLAGTFPKPICWAVCSTSEDSDVPEELRSLDEETLEQIEYANLREPEELRDLILHCKTGAFKTFVLDHTLGFENVCIKRVGGMQEMPSQRSWGMLDQQAWGVVTGMFKDLIGPMLGLKCNVICIGQERIYEPKEGSELGKFYGSVAHTPKIREFLEFSFSYQVRTFMRTKVVEEKRTIMVAGKQKEQTVKKEVKGEWDYFLQTVQSDPWKVKFRMPKPQEDEPQTAEIKNPTYERIIETIRGR